ncbi:MAG: acetyl-CoA carboxylase carboxyl transferase subunit beta [Oscillospiraceae bacterium]|nr:acetyl-CoA carboxylase carboxyl transferase subunit beta [Oscillospiraceae bacterium]
MIRDLLKKARYTSVAAGHGRPAAGADAGADGLAKSAAGSDGSDGTVKSAGTATKSAGSVGTGATIPCPSCGKQIVREEFLKAYKVCPLCGRHERLSVPERLQATVDPGSFESLFDEICPTNPLHFPGYTQKIETLKKKTGLSEAVVTGRCTILGAAAMLAVMDSRFLMASMGGAVGEKLVRLFELAGKEGLPIVVFIASGGARMQEGIHSLMQMAKVSGAVGVHGDGGGLYIAVLTDPTTGGVTASFAMLGDIILAEPGALIGFTGRRVIEGTIRQKLPDGFQSAEFQQDCGFVDSIVPRARLRETLGKLLAWHA